MQMKKKKWLKRGLIAGALTLVLGAGLTVYLLQRPPAVWREAQQVLDNTTEVSRKEITDRVVQRLSLLVNQSLADEPTKRVNIYGEHGQAVNPTGLSDRPLDRTVKLTLTNEEMIAVVNETFVQWTNDRGYIIPGGVNDPVVLARGGQLVVAFMIDTPRWQQVFTGDLSLDFEQDGMANGSVDQLYAGSLPMSVLSFGELLRVNLPEQDADRLGEWLANLEGFHFRPVLEIEHRRRARVLSVDVGDRDVTMLLRVQDHMTYKQHNGLMAEDKLAVTDPLNIQNWDGSAFADVPTTTD